MTLPAAAAAAAANTETYVAAYRALGLDNAALSADLVRELWGAEDGLSLAALDADSDALRAVADAADDGVRAQREALTILAEAWQGPAGSAATARIAQHCAATEGAVAALRDAAAVLGSLRDRLGQLLEAKADAAIRIDGRAAWGSGLLADAAAVLDGTADGSAAAAVRHRIAPYVEADVQSDWVSAMRAATESVAAAYEQSAARLASEQPVEAGGGGSPAAAARPVGAAAQTPPPMAPAVTSGAGGPVPLPDLSGLLPPVPDLGAPLATLVAHIAEALGEDPEPADRGPRDESTATPERERPHPAPAAEPDTPATTPRGRPVDAVTAVPAIPPAEPAQTSPPAEPAQTSPPAEPAQEFPPAEHEADRTPCEIAADELPQAGP